MEQRPLAECMDEFRKQLEKGVIQKAYQGLMEYIMSLRTHFKNGHSDCFVSGLYYGYMDMTYFAFAPESLRKRSLKAAIVFNYDRFRFEVWLAAANRQLQQQYWKLLDENGWSEYSLVPPAKGVDAIVEHVLADKPDFSDPAALTKQIENRTLNFIASIEGFLAKH